MNNLSLVLKKAGRGAEATQWWWRAAEAGHPGSMNNLGVILRLAGREA